MQLMSDGLLLRMLRSVGATCVHAPSGNFDAVFENSYVAAQFANVAVEETGPFLECRTCDVRRLGLVKGTALTIDDQGEFLFRRHEPDGTGFSLVYLDKL